MIVKSKKSTLVPESTNELASSDFQRWGKRFFAYLVKEKSGTNPALLDLIYCLLDDGRRELALSVFNFLRTDQWKQFCRERQIAKYTAQKQLSAAKSDLLRAAELHGKMLGLFPELGYCRNIGESRPIHLSDLLEEEATFLSAQARIMRCSSHKSTSIDAPKARQLFSKVCIKLTRAARSYRRLLTLTETIRIAVYFTSFSPIELKARLESQAADLGKTSTQVNSAFNKKRIGINVDWAFLVRLQDFIEEFGLCLSEYSPTTPAKNLNESDLADLLEAGENAWNPDDDRISTDAESIGRAIERFRQRENNVHTCLSLRRNAQEICDRLALWNRLQGSVFAETIQRPVA